MVVGLAAIGKDEVHDVAGAVRSVMDRGCDQENVHEKAGFHKSVPI